MTFEEDATEKPKQWLAYGGHLAGLSHTVSQPVAVTTPDPQAAAMPLGRLYPDNDPVGDHEIAASIVQCGSGKIAAVYVDLGERYLHGASFVVRDFLSALVRTLMPKPAVEVTGSHDVDVTLARQGDALVVNLVNTAGPHANGNVYAFDDIPPLGPLDILLRVDTAPDRVWPAPEDVDLAYTYAVGEVHLTLDRLDIHTAIVVE